MPLLAFLIFAFLVFGPVAIVIYTQRKIGDQIESVFKRNLIRTILIFIGLAAGISLASVAWSYSDTQRIIGIPIPVAAIEFRDGHWMDFVSPISSIYWIVDVIFWVGFFHLLAAYWLFIARRRSNSLPKVD